MLLARSLQTCLGSDVSVLVVILFKHIDQFLKPPPMTGFESYERFSIYHLPPWELVLKEVLTIIRNHTKQNCFSQRT